MVAVTRRFPPCATPRTIVGIAPADVRDMAVQEGRSKDRVVRLEPFFTNTPVAPLDRPVPEVPERSKSREIRPVSSSSCQAARAAAAVDSNRTLTRFDTPDSSIVTP